VRVILDTNVVGAELAVRHPARAEALSPILALIATHATMVVAPPLESAVSMDPDDDVFLAAADAARVDVVVSGDQHLLAVTGWQGVEVLTPRQFLDRHL
jgi:predicted nucleic acid-binding protein